MADRRCSTAANRALLAVAAAYVLVELVATVAAHPSYGYFYDEFYYIASAKRPALGYVDHPPFAMWLLAITRILLGDSQLGIRVLPALAGGGVVLLTGLLARRFGAGFWGQTVAGLCILTTPLMLAYGSFFSMNCFGLLFWTTACYLIVRLIQTENTSLWLVFGLFSGIALLNKHAYAMLLITLFAGLMATPLRRQLGQPRLWAGVGLGLLCLFPNVVWQAAHGWPAIGFYRDLARDTATLAPLGVLEMQFEATGAGGLIWVPGLLFFLASKRARPYRIFGVAYLVGLAILMLLEHRRPDRIAGFFPVLFAGGATLLEDYARQSLTARVGFVTAVAAGVFVAVLAAPTFLPILSPERLAAYGPVKNRTEIQDDPGGGPIPLLLANRTGWDLLLDETARVHRELGVDGSDAVLLADGFGAAGALELLGPAYGLPAVYSPSMTYAIWAQEEAPVNPPLVIAVGFAPWDLEALFGSVERVGSSPCPYCMRWRDGMPIYVAREPRRELREIVAQLHHATSWKEVVRDRMQRSADEALSEPREAAIDRAR